MSTKLRLAIFDREDFMEDIEILQRQLFKAGYSATKEDISFAWAAYSGHLCAQWLVLEDADSNVENILPYFREEE